MMEQQLSIQEQELEQLPSRGSETDGGNDDILTVTSGTGNVTFTGALGAEELGD